MFRILVLLWAGLLTSSGADLTVKVSDNPAPTEVSEPIRALLQNKAVQLLAGERPVFEFWLVRELPLKSRPASNTNPFGAVPVAALLGVVSLSATGRDYRDDDVPPGIYTMRYLPQPQDGNHLGTAEFPSFALLVSPKLDAKPDSFTEAKPLVRASGKANPTDHPLVLSLRPASVAGSEFPTLATPIPEHKSVAIEMSARVPGDASPISIHFEIVYQGIGHK